MKRIVEKYNLKYKAQKKLKYYYIFISLKKI